MALCECVRALFHVCSGVSTASLTIGVCVYVCLECEIHLRNDDCFSHASDEPKRPPATGGVCVSYPAPLCGNWISRDEFDSVFAHSVVLAGVLQLQNRSLEDCRSVSISSPTLVLREQTSVVVWF